MKKKFTSMLLCFLLMALTLTTLGCGSDNSSVGENSLVVGELWAINSIDPATNGTLTTEKAMLTESLVGVKPNFELEPGLATKWNKVDANTWEFTLRKGIKFHDDTSMDADAVKWSLMRAVKENPQVAAFTKIKSVETKGTDTIIVTTSQPNGDLPASMHYSSAAIIAPSSVDKDGKFIKPVGTGPFKLDQWNSSTGIVKLSKYTGYWGKVSKLDKLEIRPLPDPNTRALSLEKGEINFTCDPPYNELDRLKKEKGLKVELHQTARTYIIEMNLNEELFKDVNVRKALSYAIDRKSIAKDVLFGCGTPAIGPYMPEMAWTNKNLKGYPYDIQKSKQLLSEAGWKDTNGDGIVDKNGKPMKITLMTYPERPGLPPIAQAIQAQFKQVGVDVKVQVMTSSAIGSVVSTGKWDMKMSAFATAMIPTPSYHLQVIYHSKNNAKIGYNNSTVDNLIDKCMASDSKDEKYEISKQVQQIIEDEVPVLPIAYYGIAVASKDNVENYIFNPTAHDYNLNTEVHIK